VIGAPTYPMLRDATQTAMFELLERSELNFEFNKAENMLVLADTDSKILFRSLDEYERLRGMNLAWFGVDELTYTNEEAWLRLEGRLRDPAAQFLCGFAVWTPKGFDWVYRKFVQDRKEGYELIQAKPFENRYLLDKVPDFYERLESSYDAAFYAQEVMGDYLNPRRGLVYEAFNRREHVADLMRDDSLPLRWALDFNVDPLSSVVAQIRDGEVEVLDEIVLSRASTEQACIEFVNRFPSWRRGLLIYADASGRNLQTTGTSDAAIIGKFFQRFRRSDVTVKIPSSNPGVRDRVLTMNAKLKNAANEIGVRISPKCKELLKDFEEVTWVEGTHEIDKARDKKRTHLSDALGYMLHSEFGKRDTIGPRKNGFGPGGR
jgi:hypothetical protein